MSFVSHGGSGGGGPRRSPFRRGSAPVSNLTRPHLCGAQDLEEPWLLITYRSTVDCGQFVDALRSDFVGLVGRSERKLVGHVRGNGRNTGTLVHVHSCIKDRVNIYAGLPVGTVVPKFPEFDPRQSRSLKLSRG